MFYTIYKTTNIINNKYYIGKHQTNDLGDGYIGSGKILKRAIAKYGIENFHKEILHICPTEKQMNILEKILVVPDSELNYNLCLGGKGGFGYINLIGKNRKYSEKDRIKSGNKISEKWKNDPIWAEKRRIEISIESKNKKTFLGKTHTSEWKQKHSAFMKQFKGKKNSQFGTCWITNGSENKKIKISDLDMFVKTGYYRGRI